MTTTTRVTLSWSILSLALGLALTPAAHAAEMKKPAGMQAGTMGKDTATRDDMGKNAMHKDSRANKPMPSDSMTSDKAPQDAMDKGKE